MSREPFVLKGQHMSVSLSIVDAPEGRFAWKIVVAEDQGSGVSHRLIVGPLSYSTLEEADEAGKMMQAKIAKGAA